MGPERVQEDFVPLHVHSLNSFDRRDRGVLAVSSPKDLVARAKHHGYQAVAITDWGNFYGLPEALRAAEKTGVRAIIGVELALYPTELHPEEPLGLLAKNEQGILDLFALVNQVSLNGQVLTAAQLNPFLFKGNLIALLRGDADPVMDLLGFDNAFYAIDRPDRESFKKAKEVDVFFQDKNKTVNTLDIRMTRPGQVPLIRLLAKLFPKSLAGLNLNKLYPHVLQPPELVVPLYPKGTSGRSVEIAQEAQAKMPVPPDVKARCVPEGVDSFAFFKAQVLTSLSKYEGRLQLKDRVDLELDLIDRTGFTDYLLICLEISRFCQSRGIEYTVIGSGNNSLVLSLLGVTKVEASGLMFERFINPERVKLDQPDIDFMFGYERLPEVRRYILERYPESIYLTVIRKMRRKSLVRLFAEHPELGRPSNQLLTELQDVGIRFQTARHPTGILVTGRSTSPQEKSEKGDRAQWDKDGADSLGLAKIDTLSSVAVQRIETTKKLLEADRMTSLVPADDQEAIRAVFEGQLVFDYAHTPHLMRLLQSVARVSSDLTRAEIDRIQALARTGPGTRADYLDYLASSESELAIYPELKEILGPTNYVVIFQDQTLRIGRDLAGLSLSDANRLTKMMTGGSVKEEALALLEQVIGGLKRRGYPQNVQNNLITQVKGLLRYGFVEGHARALGDLVYQQACLFTHYPDYFGAAVLKTVGDKGNQLTYSPQGYINALIRRGVKMIIPHDPNLIDQDPKVDDSLVILGRTILGGHQFHQKHALYQAVKPASPSVSEIMAAQYEVFGISFIDNPISFFPDNYHFNPDRGRQTIVGLPIARREYAPPDQEPLLFLTLDSGQIVHTVVPSDQLVSRVKRTSHGFYHLTIEPSDYSTNSWNVV